ncbi:MAG: hypothetical protein ACAH80_00105 [Alphaproteobacteria bacterium]
MKTYVEFIQPDKKIPAGRATVVEVEHRDPAKLSIPAKTDILYFYDSPRDVKDDPGGDQHNCSKFYIVATKLLTREEAKELIAGRPLNAMSQIVWDVKLEKNSLFALTRNRNIEVVGKNNIVVDAKGQQLWPKPRVKKQLVRDFNTATERAITVGKPLKLKGAGPKAS